MDNINISTTQEVDVSLQADDIDYIVLNDGITELQSAIEDIVSDDKLTAGIITAVGDTKYQPIGDYVTNTELNDKGYITAIPDEYVTESELEAKGYITTLKTVNGESLIGEGDIVIHAGNDGYTKEEADAKFQPKGEYLTAIPDNYITEEKLNAKGYITAIPDEYVTDSELEAKGYLTEHQSLKTINGESIVGSGDITITGGGGGSADLTNYYTKAESDEKFQPVGEYLTSVPEEYITETELNSKGYLTEHQSLKTINGNSILGSGDITITGGESADLSDYYNKAEIDSMIGDISTLLAEI